jgi:hypothetical protein
MAATITPPAGRPKGVQNKVSGTVKDNMLAVFNRLGGTSKMAEWAEANLTEFYKLYARLIPTDVKLSGDADNPLQVVTEIRRTIVDP